jgi:hypothetical protein
MSFAPMGSTGPIVLRLVPDVRRDEALPDVLTLGTKAIQRPTA